MSRRERDPNAISPLAIRVRASRMRAQASPGVRAERPSGMTTMCRT